MNIQHTAKPILEVKNLAIAYGKYFIQKNLTFTVNEQDVFIIMGASGSGKSSLLQVLIGLKTPAKGQIFYEGNNFLDLTEKERFNYMHKVGVLFQSSALWTSMTLAENIALPLQRYTTLSPDAIKDQITLKLMLVGLSGFEDYYPSELSGGMRKRAGLARALAMDPKLVFFDEPSAGLDPISAGMLDELILELTKSLNMTAVVVTHDLESIFAIGNNSIFLDSKTQTMLAYGNPKELKQNTQEPELISFLNRGKKL